MKSILLLLMATSCVLSPVTATAQTPVLLRTFNNPTPAAGDNFGAGIAALGSDRVLVGSPYDDTSATNAGVVYLFHTNGTLLTTFTNPSPAYSTYFGSDLFGSAVAAVGSDLVLIGSPHDTRAYLFTTNGNLVTTLDTPHSEDSQFGSVVGAFGNDRVLIGTPEFDSDPEAGLQSGLAYLYSTNGTLLAFLDNPYPGNYDQHGFSVVAFGSDRVLVGVPGLSLVHLFSTNGTSLTIFTNPTPPAYGHRFGHSVAAVGTERVLIGAPEDDTGATNAGLVYVFNANGTLLTTITNPTPAVGDNFGDRMAMLGNDRVLISAPGDDTTGTDSGSAYVFNVNGTLVATLNNPSPATGDRFGSRLAAFGSEGAIIGAPDDDTGAANAGSAYLFNIPSPPAAPLLTIQLTATNTVVVSWPSAATSLVLQQNTNGIGTVNWSNVTASIQNDGTSMTLVVNPTNASRFYRLVNP